MSIDAPLSFQTPEHSQPRGHSSDRRIHILGQRDIAAPGNGELNIIDVPSHDVTDQAVSEVTNPEPAALEQPKITYSNPDTTPRGVGLIDPARARKLDAKIRSETNRPIVDTGYVPHVNSRASEMSRNMAATPVVLDTPETGRVSGEPAPVLDVGRSAMKAVARSFSEAATTSPDARRAAAQSWRGQDFHGPH